MKNTKLKDADAGYAESERPVYTESDELRAARDALAAAESAKPKEYSSAYSKDIEDLAKRILSGEKFSYDFNADPERMLGHAGGDTVLLSEFLDLLHGAEPEGITSLEASMESHFICFGAEDSRLHDGTPVAMTRYRP